LGKFCAHLLFDIAIVGKVEDGGYEAEIKPKITWFDA
jgi:hypothetical protein